MPSQDHHLKALGKALVARRTSLDPARHRTRDGWMETVHQETRLSKRVIIDIETGARDNYSTDTITALEGLYRVRALTEALAGAPLLTERGEALYPQAEEDPQDRYRTEERRARLSGAVWRIVRDLEADTEGIPEEEAEEMIQRAISNAETQAKLMLHADRQSWVWRKEAAARGDED